VSLEYSFSITDRLLQVRTKGFDDGLDEAVSYGEAIINYCLENKCRQVLMDESEMSAVLDEVSQYEMVQRLLTQIPYGLDVAIVANSMNQKETSFGVLVAENRGVHISIFDSVESARAWLKEQKMK